MSDNILIRNASEQDVPVIFQLIEALASYEKLSDMMTGTIADLHNHLFGEKQYVEALVAEYDQQVVGFALFFHNYSTFLTKPGIYLEDLFVLPDYRGKGIGKKLLINLAQLAVERNCGRLEWSVLDWNQPAINFYKKMGATICQEWQICRVTADALTDLANKIR